MSPDRATLKRQIDALPGIKQAELKPCALCGKPPAHDNYPLFWRLNVERFCVDGDAVRRQQGLELMLGSPALARAMGTDEDIAKAVFGPRQLLVCEPCVTDHLHGLYIAMERDEA